MAHRQLTFLYWVEIATLHNLGAEGLTEVEASAQEVELEVP